MEKIEPLRMGLKLRNSLTGKLVIDWLRHEEFVPIKGNQIR
jgi:hypothetical protein